MNKSAQDVKSTGYRLKQLLHHGVVFGLTSSLQTALSFILLPLYTKYLSVEDFGNYNMLLIIAATCNTVFGLGASTALGRYYYEYKEQKQEKKIISSALLISGFGTLLLILLSVLTAYPVCFYYFKNTELQLPFIICMVANALSYPVTTITLLLRYKKQSVFYLIVTIVGLILNFCITMSLLINSDNKICAPFIGQTISQSLLLVTLLLYERKDITVNVPYKDLKLVFLFGIQIILSSFLSYIYECSDKVVMKEMLSISDVGIYSLSGRIASVFKVIVYLPFVLIWAPLRMEYKDSPDNVSFVRKITNYYSLFGMLFILGCMVWGYDILQLLFPQPEYLLSLKLYPLIMLGFLFYGYLSIFDFGVFIYNKLYYLSIIPLFCLIVNVGLNITLLPVFGVSASAYIFVLTYVLASFILLYFSNKYYPIPMNWGRLIGIYSMWIIVYALFFFVDIPLSHTLWMKFITTILLIAFSWKFLLRPSEKVAILSKIKSLRK